MAASRRGLLAACAVVAALGVGGLAIARSGSGSTNTAGSAEQTRSAPPLTAERTVVPDAHAADDSDYNERITASHEELATLHPNYTWPPPTPALGSVLSLTPGPTATPRPATGPLPLLVDTLPHDLVAVTPDGRVMLVRGSDPANNIELFAMPDTGTVRPAIELSHDRSAVYVSSNECTSHTWRVPLDGGEAVEVATGTIPELSHDGRYMAYAAKHHVRAGEPRPDDISACSPNVLVIRDLRDGTEREWPMPTRAEQAGVGFVDIAYSRDGSALALMAAFEGSSLAIFRPDVDTELFGTFVFPDEATRDAVTPGWRDEPDLSSNGPAVWLANGTLLHGHSCCYGTLGGLGLVLVDPLSTATTPYDGFGKVFPMDLDAAEQTLLGNTYRGRLVFVAAAGTEPIPIAEAGVIQDALWLEP